MSGLEKRRELQGMMGIVVFCTQGLAGADAWSAACSPAFISHRAEAGGMAEKDDTGF